jgi:predicted nicotinamide N-methyase
LPWTFGHGDVLTLSEMFYDEGTSRLLRALAEGVVARGGNVLVADGERKFLPLECLRRVRRGVVTVNAELEGVSQRRVGVFEWVS